MHRSGGRTRLGPGADLELVGGRVACDPSPSAEGGLWVVGRFGEPRQRERVWEERPGSQGGNGGRLPARPPARPPVLCPGDPAHAVPGLQEGGRGCVQGLAPAAPGGQRPASEPGPRPAPALRGDGAEPPGGRAAGAGPGAGPSSGPAGPSRPRACQGHWVPAQPALCPTPSCWEPQPSRTSSRMASPKPSSVLSKGTSKCGYSQETSKVGAGAAALSREREQTGDHVCRVPPPACPTCRSQHCFRPTPTLSPGREKRNS